MVIYDVLNGRETAPSSARHNDFYNGSLREYIESSANIYKQYNELFEQLLQVQEDLRVCANLPLSVNPKTVSNQIIHYKDAFKIEDGSIKVPLIVYWQKDEFEKAIIFSDQSYIEAKGLYYCMTEPEGPFGACRNEIIALLLSEESTPDILRAFNEMHENKRAVGAIQRYYDHKHIDTVDEMKDRSVELAQSILNSAVEILPGMEDKAPLINKTIGRIFLIKKAVYVQYMMTKDILLNRHEGDVKKQRQFAKAYATEIPIISLSSLWRTSLGQDDNEAAYENTED